MTKPINPESPPVLDENESARRTLRSMTRRGFAVGGLAALSGFAGWKWLTTRSLDGGTLWPLRKVFEFNAQVQRSVFGTEKLAPEFATGLARMPRVNGRIGLDLNPDPAAWRLNLTGPSGSKSYTIDEIKALPRVEITTELKCIEGWSIVVTWAGARLSDLASKSGLATQSGRPINLKDSAGDVIPYVSATTPDQAYYVGLEAASAFHPQTLLCYEMNQKPLEPLHGAPLRLAVPIKYGIKSLKQVGSIAFTGSKPADYWAKKGYDWDSGH